MIKPIDFVATLLEGKVKYQKLPSGSSDYIEFYDKNGEIGKETDVDELQNYYPHEYKIK